MHGICGARRRAAAHQHCRRAAARRPGCRCRACAGSASARWHGLSLASCSLPSYRRASLPSPPLRAWLPAACAWCPRPLPPRWVLLHVWPAGGKEAAGLLAARLASGQPCAAPRWQTAAGSWRFQQINRREGGEPAGRQMAATCCAGSSTAGRGAAWAEQQQQCRLRLLWRSLGQLGCGSAAAGPAMRTCSSPQCSTARHHRAGLASTGLRIPGARIIPPAACA